MTVPSFPPLLPAAAASCWRAARGLGAYERTTILVLLLLFTSVPFHLGPPTPDVSWLNWVCESMLDGKALYTDIFETNPPIPVLLYMPAVLLARLTGLTSATGNILVTYAATWLAIHMAQRIISRKGFEAAPELQLFPIAAAVCAFSLSSDVFAQRDYFAGVFGLPLIAVFLRHASLGAWPGLWERATAAAFASLTLAIKPPLFALPGAFLALYYLYRTRDLSFLIKSGLLAAAAGATLLTSIAFAAFPQYFGEVLGILRDVYVPLQAAPLVFLANAAALATTLCLLIIIVLAVRRGLSSYALVALFPALGFIAADLVQAKFFPYQLFPAYLYVFLATTVAVYPWTAARLSSRSDQKYAVTIMLAALFIVFAELSLQGFYDSRPRPRNVGWMKGLDGSTVAAISPDVAIAFPLIQQFNGQWISPTHSQWIAKYARKQMADTRRPVSNLSKMFVYYNDDIKHILEVINNQKPQIILVDVAPDRLWLLDVLLARQPDLLSAYIVLAEDERIRVMQRK